MLSRLLSTLLLGILLPSSLLLAQVKISDNPSTTLTVDSNAILQLESTNKGFLPPYVVLQSLSQPNPLTAGYLRMGTLVYDSTGTNVPKGLYRWNGQGWVLLGDASQDAVISINSNTNLTKSQNHIHASNSTGNHYIRLTLPSIGVADNGLKISIKNTGSYLGIVEVLPDTASNPAARIDGSLPIWLFANEYLDLHANNGNWVVHNQYTSVRKILDVGPANSWHNLHEVFHFLQTHSGASGTDGGVVVRLAPGEYRIDSTITISLPYPVTVQGPSYGHSSILPSASLADQPLFDVRTESYFKYLDFISDISTFGDGPNEDAIQLTGSSGTYCEIKDATFEGFRDGIEVCSNIEAWVFDCDLASQRGYGIHINDTSTSIGSVFIKISEADFLNNSGGIGLVRGDSADISIMNCGFYPGSGNTGLVRTEATFTSITSAFISNNNWDGTGTFATGFDFSRTDGRDANVLMHGNGGAEESTPIVQVEADNNTWTTVCTSTTNWYYVRIDTTNVNNFKYSAYNWRVNGNKITYLSDYPADVVMFFNLTLASSSNNNTDYRIAIIKNTTGTTMPVNTTTVYGRMPVRYRDFAITGSSIAYLKDVKKGDTFQLFISATANNRTITVADVQWYSESP
jgi:hypothetical protein